MYSILIKEKANSYRFLSVKKEIMKETIAQVTDPDTQEVKDEVTLIGTGEYETVSYEESDKEKFEEKCTELLKTYNLNELKFIDNLQYGVDLIWN